MARPSEVFRAPGWFCGARVRVTWRAPAKKEAIDEASFGGGAQELTERAGGLSPERFFARATLALAGARAKLIEALEEEWSQRRFFLWLPVCAGAGVCLYLLAPTEPALALTALLAVFFAALAVFAADRRALMLPLAAVAAFFAGEALGGLRALRVAAPVLERIYVGEIDGFVEEVDYRPQGARVLLRLSGAEKLDPAARPYRLRVTTRGFPGFVAGDFIQAKARLLPPAHAPLPGGYDFARDAFFARIGAVGSLLGTARLAEPPGPAPGA